MRLSPFILLDRQIAPAPAAERVAFLTGQAFAHRGLHDGAGGSGAAIENSRAAFLAAIAAGHGIELDVQAALGGEAFVFHDVVLDRLTEAHGPFASRTANQLETIRLRGSAETIPRLSEILGLIGGRVPLLIEVKTTSTKCGALALTVRRALEGYRGAVAVMSFNPGIASWFAKHAPQFVRGLVMTETDGGSRLARARAALMRHMLLWRARPDFLAYDIRRLPSPFASAQRERGLPVLAWTVRSAEQERTALIHADEIIYEQPGASAA